MRRNELEAARDALLPFRPGKDGAWDTGAAAHLARRAAFGAPVETVNRIEKLGPRKAARELLEPVADDEGMRIMRDSTRRLGSLESVQGWWVYRMLLGSRPAREKLALFWHGHFATSNRKVEKARLMMTQVELFERLGTGPFGELLLEMARDGAMLIWLDGNSNRRGKPNENFARELMELFSLGIGNYTEDDIKEAARAFTGWHVRDGKFWYNRRAHDQGVKSVFGHTGDFGGEDIVRLCLGRPACAEFIAVKLFEYYVHLKPSPELRVALGEMYEKCEKKTGLFLERLWSSRVFFADTTRRSLVATPVDFVVGSLATIGATANTSRLADAMRHMGQDLLQPPSVKGWDPGMAWLNSTTLLARYRFAAEVAGGKEVDANVPWDELEKAGAAGIIGRFFPEGLDAGVKKDIEREAGEDTKLLVAACLQLPEHQYV